MSSPALANVALRKLFSRPSSQLSTSNPLSRSSNGPLSNLHNRILLHHHFLRPYSKGTVHPPPSAPGIPSSVFYHFPLQTNQKKTQLSNPPTDNSPAACAKTKKPLETNACSSPRAPIQRKSAILWSRSIAAVCVALALLFERDRGKLDCFLSGEKHWWNPFNSSFPQAPQRRSVIEMMCIRRMVGPTDLYEQGVLQVGDVMICWLKCLFSTLRRDTYRRLRIRDVALTQYVLLQLA